MTTLLAGLKRFLPQSRAKSGQIGQMPTLGPFVMETVFSVDGIGVQPLRALHVSENQYSVCFHHTHVKLFGRISKISPINLDNAALHRLGVSNKAKHFVWAYPVSDSSKLKLADLDPMARQFVNIGGFIYMDDKGEALQAITPLVGASLGKRRGIVFDASCPLPPSIFEELLFQPVTAKELSDQGAKRFAWVPPCEAVPFGGFAYIFQEQPLVCSCFPVCGKRLPPVERIKLNTMRLAGVSNVKLEYLELLREAGVFCDEGEAVLREEDAVMVINTQTDFIDGAIGNTDAETSMEKIVQLLRQASKTKTMVMASRAYYPEDHPSFLRQGGELPPHCIQDSAGSKFPEPVAVALKQCNYRILFKGFTRSRSALSAVAAEDPLNGGVAFDLTANIDPNSAPTVELLRACEEEWEQAHRFPSGATAAHTLLQQKRPQRVFVCGPGLDLGVLDTAVAVKRVLPGAEVYIVIDATCPMHSPGFGRYGSGFFADPHDVKRVLDDTDVKFIKSYSLCTETTLTNLWIPASTTSPDADAIADSATASRGVPTEPRTNPAETSKDELIRSAIAQLHQALSLHADSSPQSPVSPPSGAGATVVAVGRIDQLEKENALLRGQLESPVAFLRNNWVHLFPEDEATPQTVGEAFTRMLTDEIAARDPSAIAAELSARALGFAAALETLATHALQDQNWKVFAHLNVLRETVLLLPNIVAGREAVERLLLRQEEDVRLAARRQVEPPVAMPREAVRPGSVDKLNLWCVRLRCRGAVFRAKLEREDGSEQLLPEKRDALYLVPVPSGTRTVSVTVTFSNNCCESISIPCGQSVLRDLPIDGAPTRHEELQHQTAPSEGCPFLLGRNDVFGTEIHTFQGKDKFCCAVLSGGTDKLRTVVKGNVDMHARLMGCDPIARITRVEDSYPKALARLTACCRAGLDPRVERTLLHLLLHGHGEVTSERVYMFDNTYSTHDLVQAIEAADCMNRDKSEIGIPKRSTVVLVVDTCYSGRVAEELGSGKPSNELWQGLTNVDIVVGCGCPAANKTCATRGLLWTLAQELVHQRTMQQVEYLPWLRKTCQRFGKDLYQSIPLLFDNIVVLPQLDAHQAKQLREQFSSNLAEQCRCKDKE
eukprot:TRINITY_DN69145_c0_g1_i1.p1 TRINITY_DN69145_c0_g1~~TRINITY_DN69145_c0_g1_i1.p1  ORF type:complete len:1114 (-),score=148.73 TRINITY_DN69145_c0_g1_i1:2-3343(-)